MSVIIPTYNCGPLVVEAVRSVLAQSLPATEIIVIDDGSTDDTHKRIAEFDSRIRYVQQQNGGVSAARNRGIAESACEWIAFLDADDVWHPRKLEFQFAELEQKSELGLLATRTYPHPGPTSTLPSSTQFDVEEIRFDELVVHNLLATSSVIVRAAALREAGPFDLAMRGPEDHDMWIRVGQRVKIGRLMGPLTGYRDATPGSLSKNAPRMEAGMKRILEKLEATGVFAGRPLLRRKACAQFRFVFGLTYRAAGELHLAASLFARSLARWPFRIHPAQNGIDRFRALLSILWRICSRSAPSQR